MKKIIFIVFLFSIVLPITSQAQSGQSEIDYIKKIFQMEKKAITSEYMDLSGEAQGAFWTLYDAYETERKALAQRRIKLLLDYAEQYNKGMTDDQATTLVKENLAIQKKTLALKKKYFKKMSKAVGVPAATSFYQLEDYIQTAVKFEILDVIPFVNQ